MTEEYNRRRRYIYNGLRSIGIESFEPEGAFYIYPDIRRFGRAPIPSASACSMRTAVPLSPAPPSETAARALPYLLRLLRQTHHPGAGTHRGVRA